MELLKERIRREGKVLPGNIIKVDGFLNHRVDTKLLEALADEFAKYFDISKITMVNSGGKRHRFGHDLRPEIRCSHAVRQEGEER